MEDTHGEIFAKLLRIVSNCLNPYYNGRYSWSEFTNNTKGLLQSLNPYYNGRYSWSFSVSLIHIPLFQS